MRRVVQFSIDIEIDDTDNMTEKDIEKALFSYWYVEKIPNREVLGIQWKATWTSEGYSKGELPISSD